MYWKMKEKKEMIKVNMNESDLLRVPMYSFAQLSLRDKVLIEIWAKISDWIKFLTICCDLLISRVEANEYENC